MSLTRSRARTKASAAKSRSSAVWPADIWSAQWNQVLDKVWNPEFDKFWKGEITAEQLVKTIDPETTKLLQGA